MNLCKEFPECFLGYSIRTRTLRSQLNKQRHER
nr:MAG TPA: hypothetical protein [Caudoviricetes sp.]